jgi:hypothetical protein
VEKEHLIRVSLGMIGRFSTRMRLSLLVHRLSVADSCHNPDDVLSGSASSDHVDRS